MSLAKADEGWHLVPDILWQHGETSNIQVAIVFFVIVLVSVVEFIGRFHPVSKTKSATGVMIVLLLCNRYNVLPTINRPRANQQCFKFCFYCSDLAGHHDGTVVNHK